MPRRFRPACRDLLSIYAGYYIAELLSELIDEDDPHPKLFDLPDETLQALAAGDSQTKDTGEDRAEPDTSADTDKPRR